MSHQPRRPAARGILALALGGALVLLTLGASGALAQGSGSAGSPGPEQPVTGSPIAPGEPNPTGDGSTPAVPDPRVLDPRPSSWDHVTIGADGRTVTIYYWNGVDSCYGLHHVDVSISADGVPQITIFTGSLPLPPNTACREIAMLYSTVVVLDTPIITDGSATAA